MKVQDTGIINKTSKFKRKLNSRNNTQFSDIIDDNDSISEILFSSITKTNSLLSLQEASINDQDKKEINKKRAADIISYLEETRLSLLTGQFSKTKLEEINYIIENRQSINFDLKLDSILDEIELRAAVELAKIRNIKK